MSTRNEIRGVIPVYPGVKRIGWLPSGSITEEQEALLRLGSLSVTVSGGVTWVQTLDTPTLSEARNFSSHDDDDNIELNFKIDEIQFPKNCIWVIVDAQDTAWLVGGRSPHSGEYEVKRSTSQASGEAVCLSVRLTSPFIPRRIRLG